MRFHFRQYTPGLETVPKIIVDSANCGVGLQLSHWPGNKTPLEFKADLSVEIVFRFLSSPLGLTRVARLQVITNDHYDTDGVLAVWALMNPIGALRHGPALTAAAAAGDFYEFTSPKAVQFDLLVRAFEREQSAPLGADPLEAKAYRWQRAMQRLFAEMPALLYEPQRHVRLWEEDYRQLIDKIALLQRGFVEVREFSDVSLSVLSTRFPLDHFTRNIACKGHRILETSATREGATYELHYREFLWYDIVSRRRTFKHLLYRAAEQLNGLEETGVCGSWGVTRWTPALRFVASPARPTLRLKSSDPLGQSSLPLDVVQRVIRSELRRLDDAAARCQTS